MGALDCDCIENLMGRFEEEHKADRIQNAINHIKSAADVDQWAAEIAVEAMEKELKNPTDAISRQGAIDAARDWFEGLICGSFSGLEKRLRALPSVQPEPLSDAYMKAVWTWLLDYQIKAAELKGRYTPYEVLSWVANDWRKEYEGSD